MKYAAVAALIIALIATTNVQGGNIIVFAGSTPQDVTEGGFKDGPGRQALFAFPNSICSDKEGNIYVADTGNHRIRLIRPDGLVSTYAGSGQEGRENGKGAKASFSQPDGIAVSTSGALYVADSDRVRKIDKDRYVSTAAIFEPDIQHHSSRPQGNKGSALDMRQVNKDLALNERLKLEIESLKEMSHVEG